MRILYIIDSLGVGGAETLMLTLIEAATARGHQVHLAYFTPGPLEDAMARHAASVTRLSRRGLKDPLALLRAWALIRRLRPDVVHTHLTKSEIIGQLAARLAGSRTRVLTLHNTDPWRHKRPLSAIYRLATGGVQHVVGVSTEVVRHAVETGGVAAAKALVVRNGVNIDRFQPATMPEVLPGPFRFGIIGRLQPQKDHASFLRAVAILVQSQPQIAVQIIGDGPLRAELEAMAQALGLGQQVSFTGNLADMPRVLHGLDAVVLSSAWEGLPMVLLEAMACGRAVVATSVGEVPGVLRDGENGLLVPPGSPQAMAAAMARLLCEPGLAQALGQAARRSIVQDYSDAAMIARLFALYGADQPPNRALA